MGRLRAVRALAAALVLGAALAGCAYVEYQPVNVYPQAEPGEALVYFYRQPAFFGGYIGYPVGQGQDPIGQGSGGQGPVARGQGGTEIGALVAGSYFFARFAPGDYTFWVETETRDTVSIELEAGKTYYLSSYADLGILAPRPYMEAVDAKRGAAAVRSLRYALVTDSNEP